MRSKETRKGWRLYPRPLAMLLVLTSCASNPNDAEDSGPRIQQILVAESTSDVQPDRCLSTHDYQRVKVLDDRHVVFEGSGDHQWLNQLRTRCVGLRPRATLLFDLHTNQVCNLDSFTAVSKVFWFWQRESGTCVLGTFHPVSPSQLEMIRRELRRP